MIQALGPDGPHIGVAFITEAPLHTRIARRIQSATGEELNGVLRWRTGIASGVTSKSHSRAVVASALARTGRVGIDVEYRAPGRAIEKIARFLMDADVRDDAAGYRVFTFREAYFKAFGDWPEKTLLRDVASRRDERYRLGALEVHHTDVADAFTLTLVWSA